MAYMHNIQSMQNAHPALPEIIANVDLSRQIQADTPINPVELEEAKAVAEVLKGVNRANANSIVNDAVVQTAELRVHAIQAAHATAEFVPLNLVNSLQDINNQLAAILAETRNNRIVIRNAQRRDPQPYVPLYKTAPGHGLALAQAVLHNPL